MSIPIISPFPVFNNLDGTPLENGYIYIGTANLNPETSPVNVYWDPELTIPAAQPIRTIGGYPSRSGTPSNVYVSATSFSITVRNINKGFVYNAASIGNPIFEGYPITREQISLPLLGTDSSFVQAGAGAVTRTMQDKAREILSVKDFGAVGDGVANDTNAIENAIAVAAASVGGSTGATVYFPTGTYRISNAIAMPNRVALVGNGDYAGVTIKPHSSFRGDYMFNASNGTSSMFGSYIKNFHIDARGYTMIAPVCSQAWQETCGLINVLIQFDGLTQYGFLYENGYGGAAYLRLQETQIFSDSTQINAAGILVGSVSSVGGFVLDFQNGTIAGSAANPLPSGIRMTNDSLRVNTYHAEYVVNMVVMVGKGSVSADTLTGSFNGIVNMVTISSMFTGKASLRNMIPNGATGQIFLDGVSARSIPASVGMLPSFDYEPSAFSAIVSTQINNVTGNGIEYTIVFNSETYDYLNEYNNTSGNFIAQKTGKYIFTVQVKIAVTVGVTTCVLRISTSTKDYYIYRGDTDNIYSGSGQITFNGSCIADLNAGDIAKVTILISGLGSDTVDVLPDETRFSGQWLSR
jgi:hypothetical protein